MLKKEDKITPRGAFSLRAAILFERNFVIVRNLRFAMTFLSLRA